MHSRVKVFATVFATCAIVAVVANIVIFQGINPSNHIRGPKMQSFPTPVNFDDVNGSPEFLEKWKEWRALPESRKRQWLAEPGFEWMQDYLDLVAVTDTDIPPDDFEKWVLHGFRYDEKVRVPIPNREIKRLKLDGVMFDCRPYSLNEDLKSAIQSAPKLTWLRLSKEFDENHLEWLTSLERLQGLSIKGVSIENGKLSWLASLEDLRWLELEIAEGGNLILPSLPRLEFLRMSGRGITNRHLPAPGQFPNLKSLDVNSSEVTDDGVAEIARNCPLMVTLDLGWCEGITYDCVTSLAQLKALRYLHVNHTSLELQSNGFDYQTIPELQIKLPACHIRIGER